MGEISALRRALRPEPFWIAETRGARRCRDPRNGERAGPLSIVQPKGQVRRKLAGKAFVYNLALGPDDAIREAVGDLVDRLFGESAEAQVISVPKRMSTLQHDELLTQSEILARIVAGKKDKRGRCPSLHGKTPPSGVGRALHGQRPRNLA